MEATEFNFTYKDYQKMSDKKREIVYHELYAFFNQQALTFDISQQQVYDFIFEKTLRDQNYEFSAVMRDFKLYFSDEF